MSTDKRLDRRYPFVFPIQVELAGGGRDGAVETECVEISRSGLTFACEPALIEALLEQADYPPTCTLGFALPGCPLHFEIRCHVIRHRRLSRQQFHVVALFRHFRRGNGELLSEHLLTADQTDSAWRDSGRRGDTRAVQSLNRSG